MSQQNSKLEITAKEYLQIQVRYALFKLEIKKRLNQKMREKLETNKNVAQQIVSLFQDGNDAEAFNLLTDMNYHLTNENQCMEKCQEISHNYQILMQESVGVLTSKDNKLGQARTPEMHKFKVLMDSHCQMHCKQNWDNYFKYNQNFKNKKHDNNV